jgi:hypothetical protein
MSFMDKLKSWFGGGSSDAGDAHAGHDHSADGHSHDPMPEPPAPPAPPADPIGMPTSEPAAPDDDEDQPA